jgi:AcrR family transcriptional regulator
MIIQDMGETRRLTRAEQQVRTRTRLIEAATKVFARRGFHQASVEEIAEEAGYSHGAVYSNFDGKGELFLAVFEDYMAERVRELADTQTALPDDAPPEARARALADQWMDRLDRDRQSVALHMEFIAHADREPELARRFGERSSVMREAVSRYIAQYQQETGEELAMSADDLAIVLRSLGIGLAIESLGSPGAVRHDLYGDFVELLIALQRGGGVVQRDGDVAELSGSGESAGRR